MKNVKKGFTLIELLVVILITGTLAAIALPQYQKAVLRSRAAEVWSILPTVRTAAEEYCLANGGGTPAIEELSVQFPSHMSTSAFEAAPCYAFFDNQGAAAGLLLLGAKRNIADISSISDEDAVVLALYQSGERTCQGLEENCRTLGFTKGDSYCDCTGCHASGPFRE